MQAISVQAQEATVPSVPQHAPPELADLETAFAHGDAKRLIEHAARRVDVTLFGSSELFSRSQAGYVFKEFFREYPPERLILRETTGAEGNWFASGRYWYARAEEPLAVYLRLRHGSEGWQLREIRIGRTMDR